MNSYVIDLASIGAQVLASIVAVAVAFLMHYLQKRREVRRHAEETLRTLLALHQEARITRSYVGATSHLLRHLKEPWIDGVSEVAVQQTRLPPMPLMTSPDLWVKLLDDYEIRVLVTMRHNIETYRSRHEELSTINADEVRSAAVKLLVESSKGIQENCWLLMESARVKLERAGVSIAAESEVERGIQQKQSASLHRQTVK